MVHPYPASGLDACLLCVVEDALDEIRDAEEQEQEQEQEESRSMTAEGRGSGYGYDYQMSRPPERYSMKYPEGYRAARTFLATDAMCDRCGAIVGDAIIHNNWHEGRMA
jgi:hypothetical protein